MYINQLTSAQIYALLTKIEYWIPSHIAWRLDRKGSCPYCGCIKAHDENCNLNKAIVLYMEADEAGIIWDKMVLRMEAEAIAIQVLRDLKYIGPYGFMYISPEEI